MKEIKRISDVALVLFEQEQELAIHSSYKHVINIKDHHIPPNIYAIHPIDVLITPMSLALDVSSKEFETIQIVQGESVKCNGNSLNIGTYEFVRSKQCFIENCTLIKQYNEKQAIDCLDVISKILPLCKGKGGFSDFYIGNEPEEHMLLDRALYKCLSTVKKSKIVDHETITKELLGIVGLGVGLTPSGDDYIVGFLFGLMLRKEITFRLIQCIGNCLEEVLLETNDISRNFLQYAKDGKFNSKLIKLSETNRKKEMKHFVEEIIDTGHSSGVDMINGLASALHIVLEGR
ncbi:MAG: DUF2877 domain-containing protein [Lachnospiraceae bacterium]